MYVCVNLYWKVDRRLKYVLVLSTRFTYSVDMDSFEVTEQSSKVVYKVRIRCIITVSAYHILTHVIPIS